MLICDRCVEVEERLNFIFLHYSTTRRPSDNVSNGLATGVYQVLVKDANNCLSAAQAVTVSQPLAVSFTFGTTPASCFGTSDGTITVTGSGGGGGNQNLEGKGRGYKGRGTREGRGGGGGGRWW